MSDETFQREGLGRSALAPPPLLSVSTKDLSDGAPVTPVTTSALTDTTFDSPLPSSLADSPYPERDWSSERRLSRPPSRPLSPDESPIPDRPKSMPLSPQPPKDESLPVQETTVPASGSETFGLVAPRDRPPAQTEIEEPDQERTSQKTPTPQPHATDAPHVPSPAKLPETAAEPAPVAARPLPTADVQRPQPPPPPRRLTPQTAEVLPDGALPSRSSSRTSIPPSLASTARVNGSPRLGSDGPSKLNGTAKQSPFSRLNATNNSSPQPGSSPKQASTATSPPMSDVPRTLHRSASMSSAGSSQGGRSAVSPVSVFSPTMPAPPPVPSHESAEFLAEPELHPTKDIQATGGTGVGGVAGMAGVGAAFAARQALAAHTQDNAPVVERTQLAQVPVRRSSRRALNSAFVAQANEQPTLESTTERPSLESNRRPSVESTRSSLGRSNSLDSASRNRPNVTAGWRSRTPSINSLANAAGSSERKRPLGSRPMRSASNSTTSTPPMVTSSRRVPSPEPVPSAESTTPKPEEKRQTNDEDAKDDSAKPAELPESLSHPAVRQLSLSQSQSTDTSGVATPDSGRSIGHRKTPSGNRKPAPPIDQALIEALKKESVSSDLERLQRSTPTTPVGPPAVSPFMPIEKKEPPTRIIPKKVPPPLPLTATMLNVIPPKSAAGSDKTAVPKGPLSPGLLSPTTPISPRSPISPVSAASPRHSLSSDFMARMNMPVGSRDSTTSRLSQRMSNRLSQFSARMSRRISSDSGHNHRPYMEDSAGSHDFEHSQASVVNAAVARHSTARSVSLSNGRLTPIKTSAPSSSHTSQASLPLPSPVMLNGDYRSARDITGPVEGMVIITADTPSRTTTEKGGSSRETSSTSQDKAEDRTKGTDKTKDEDKIKEEDAKIAPIEKSEKKENGIKRKAPPAADVVDLNDSPQIQQSATLSPPMNTEHFSAVSPQFVNAPRQLSAGTSPSLESSAALLREQRYPETPQMTSPTITTSPPSSLDRHSSLSQKLRLALRSKSNGEHGAQRPDFLPGSSPIASPPSPTVSNFSNSPNPNRSSIQGSLGRAFRLRAGSNSGGHQPMKGTSPGGISSDDFKHLHEKEALHGLGLGMQFPPNSYRTPSGGLGYTPPAKKGRTVSNISAEDALANIRLKNMAEQEEAQERWRRLETERAQNRGGNPLSPTTQHYDSRVQSLASSTGLSDDEALSPGRISESSERTRSFTEPDVGRPILPRSSLAERPKPHQRLSSRDLGTRESMQSLSSCGSPPRSRSPDVPRSQTRDSIATVFSSESVRSHSDVRESKVSLEPDVRSVVSPRSSYERSAKSPERERGERARTSFGQLSERERGSLYRASTFEPRLSRDTMRSTRSNGSRTSFERSARVSRTSFEPPSRMSRDNSFLASPRGLEPLDVNEQPLDEETESEREARLEAEAAEATEEARLEAERAERAAAKKAEAEKREAERLAAQQRQEAERQRQEAEKAARRAQEAARRDEQQAEVRRQLVRGHAEGGVMLRGWVTVQGVGTWRRRYFLLLARELRLFKGEGDDSPINTVTLGGKTEIDHDVYEESQVRGAWKIRGEKGEEFFMFADSETDRDVVMEGFRIAIGREV